MAICESRKISETLDPHETDVFLSGFQILPIPEAAVSQTISMMKKHNLLPNDAMILSSCKLQQVAVLASFDSDFARACSIEGILLISKVTDLPNL